MGAGISYPLDEELCVGGLYLRRAPLLSAAGKETSSAYVRHHTLITAGNAAGSMCLKSNCTCEPFLVVILLDNEVSCDHCLTYS